MDLSSTGIAQAALTQLVGPIVVALIIALLGAVAAVYLFMVKKNHGKYRGLMQKLDAHINFDRFILAGILKFLYVFSAIFAVIYGVIQLFSGSVLTGILWFILGPLGSRVAFELPLMLLSLRDEACDTNDLLRRMQGLPPKYPPQPVPEPQPVPAQRQNVQRQGNMPQAQPDPRYAQRQGAHPAQNMSFNGYVAVPRQQGQQGAPAPRQPGQQGQAAYAASQRNAPVREGYAGGGGYGGTSSGVNGGASSGTPGGHEPTARGESAPAPMVRPTPADGTGRFNVVPMSGEKPER